MTERRGKRFANLRRNTSNLWRRLTGVGAPEPGKSSQRTVFGRLVHSLSGGFTRMKPLPSINSATDDSTTGRLTFSEELELILEEDAPLRARNRPMGAFLTIKRQPRSREGYGMSANALADSCYPKLTEVLLSRAGLWEFDTFNLDRATGGHCIPAIGMYLLQKYQLIQHFNLKPENCMKLFSFIEAYYHNKNRYHNDVHATDVTQSLHIFLQEAALLPILRKTEILAVLLAALTHDLDHPGVSKSFLILTKHPIAVMYKDQEMDNQTASGEPGTSSGVFRRKKKETEGSILECHHWKMAYSCILQSGIFSHMSTRLPEIKKLLKDLIMATDISRQDEYLKLFKSFLTLKNLDMRLPEHRLLVLQIALKTADISNPGRPWSISHKWSYMVCEEFFLQGDMERQMQIPISPFCDRENDNIPHIQIGFFNNVVKPLYTAWHRYLRSELTLKMMTNLVHNTAEWKREADRCQLAQAKARENEKQKQLNHSASTECLLQEAGTHAPRISPRRSSYSPTRASAVKDALRRFSSPLQALVNAPRILSEARRTLRRSTEETRRSRTLSHLELAMAVSADRAHRALRRGSRSQERSHSPLHRPAAKTPSRAFTSSSQVHGSPRSYAARDDSINGVEKSRLGSILLAEYDSGSRYTTSPSVSNSYGPQRLSTVTDSLSVTPSSETRFEFPLALDNGKTERADGNTHGSSRNPRNVASIEQATFLGLRIDMLKIPLPSGAAGSSEAVFEPRKESCDILTCLVPEVTRRRGSAPVVATHMPRSQTAYADSRKLSASFAACHQIREDKPLVRRGSLPVMTGISAL